MTVVLIAEDEELSRKSLARLIRSLCPQDIVLHEARNGSEAVQLARAYKPALVFMDIVMPVMNGLQAAEAVLSEDPSAVIYLLTAYDYFHYAQKAIEIGVRGYILKPPKTEDIRAAFEKSRLLQSAGASVPCGTPAADARAGLTASALPEIKAGGYHRYPHEAEKAFFSDLKQHNIERAYVSGDAMLALLLKTEDELLLVKE